MRKMLLVLAICAAAPAHASDTLEEMNTLAEMALRYHYCGTISDTEKASALIQRIRTREAMTKDVFKLVFLKHVETVNRRVGDLIAESCGT